MGSCSSSNSSVADGTKQKRTSTSNLGNKKMPLLGVSAAFIRDFISKHGESMQSMTTAEVCASIIVPDTAASQKALIEAYTNQNDDQGKPFVSQATVYVSHAWQYSLTETLCAMLDFENDHPGSYYWFDLFVVNQQREASYDQEWFEGALKASIRAIKCVLLVMSPWNDPVPLTRAWCLWEIKCAIESSEVKLYVTLTAKQHEMLQQNVVNDAATLVKSLSNVRSEKAEARREDEKTAISKAIKKTIGFEKLNSIVLHRIRIWYEKTLLDLVKSEEGRLHDKLQSSFGDKRRGSSAFFGSGDSGGHVSPQPMPVITQDPELLHLALTYGQTGYVFRQFGKYDEAIKLFTKALDLKIVLYGTVMHSEVATTLSNIGSTYRLMGEFHKAIEFYENALPIRVAKCGNNHPDTAASLNNLSETYDQIGDFDRALKYSKMSMEIMIESFGADHPRTAVSYNIIGVVYMDMGDCDKALHYLNKALDIRIATFGENHATTAGSYYNIAEGQMRLGLYKESLANYKHSLDIRKSVLGPAHAETLRTQKKVEEATAIAS